jgi:hypothetical protein
MGSDDLRCTDAALKAARIDTRIFGVWARRVAPN